MSISSKPDLQVLGHLGLTPNAFIGYDEFDRNLIGERGRRIYREMSEQDPVISAVLFAIEWLIKNIEWDFEPADDTAEAERYAQFFRDCLDDMSYDWPDTVSEILTFLVYGWSLFEIIYKRRSGDASRPASKYDDNKIGWRRFDIRPQNTLAQWRVDDDGGLLGMQQIAGPSFIETLIPIEKSLLFRTRASRTNPEGRSLLRGAYRPWYFKKHLENVEGIGIERDLAGLPVATVPAKLFASDANDNDKATLRKIVEIVTSIRRDSAEGIVMPSSYDNNGRELFSLKLLSSGGSRQFDTDTIITRYDQRIAMSMLADFILLGHEAVGSFALSSDKTALFGTAVNGFSRHIASVVSKHGVTRLMRYNGMPINKAPRMVAGDVESPDLGVLSNFISVLSQAGAQLFPDETLENYLRKVAGLPAKDPDAQPVAQPVPPGQLTQPKVEPEVPPENPAAQPTGLERAGTGLARAAGEPWSFGLNRGQRRDKQGRWADTGAGGGGGSGITKVSERVFSGQPVMVNTKLSKQQTGAIGERVVIDYLKSQGHQDARPLNNELPNYAIDMVQDHEAIEVKTGLVSNSRKAQRWRMTIGQPGKAETEWLRTASAEEKAKHNAHKNEMIHKRKQDALAKVSAELGRPVKGKTMTTIINPDTKTVDLYSFEGFHQRIDWNSEQAKAGYLGTFKYED
jgi:hypothetical protein